MTSADRPPHAVLVRGVEGFSPAAVAGVLARRAKAPALDFVGPARRAWGIVAEELPAAEADELAAQLSAAGQSAVAAPTALLEAVAEPTAVLKGELSGDGFDVVSARENAAPERLSWSKLAVLCAAAVETRKISAGSGAPPTDMAEKAVRLGLTLATGLPLMKRAEKKAAPVEIRDRELTLDLIFVEPARRLRVQAGAFDYSLLGPKMGYGAEANFLTLLQELSSRAPTALRGKGARALLGRRPAAESLYESLDDLAREERWLLTLAALRAAL